MKLLAAISVLAFGIAWGVLQGAGRPAEAPAPTTLVSIKEANGLRITTSLLTPDAIASKEKRQASFALDGGVPGHTAKEQAGQITFLVNFSAIDKSVGDVMRFGVRSMGEFQQRAFDLNFQWEGLLELRCGQSRYPPALCSFENTYGLSSDRNLVVAFVPNTCDDSLFYNSEVLDLVMNDAILSTGIHHFRFDRDAFRRISKQPA